MKKKVVPGQKLAAVLDAITTELSDSERAQERSQRTLVLGALKNYTNSRFHLGETLASYKLACKVDGVWLRASAAIAKHIRINQRTLVRILSDYQRVAGVPQTVLSAMEAEGFDPAQRKNAPLLEGITETISDATPPEEIQEVVRRTAASLKPRKLKAPMSEDERIVCGLRQDIRKWLSNVADKERKWWLLQEAICQESFEVWGDTEAWIAKITPCAATTIDGNEWQTQEMAA